jgi:hypothetical protein
MEEENKKELVKIIEDYKEEIDWDNIEIDSEELKKYPYNKEGIWIPKDNK